MMAVHIAGFELRRLFLSPLAWTLLACVQLAHAVLFYLFLSRYLQQPDVYAGFGLTGIVVAGYYQSSGLIMLLITPFLTMRLFSEELRSGTIRLLLSSPVSVTTLVTGKFAGLYLFMLFMLLLISLIPASLTVGASLDYGQFGASIAGLALLQAGLAATGLFVSTLFRQPVIAAVSAFALLLWLWTSHLAATDTSTLIGQVSQYLSMLLHFNALTEGLVHTVDVAYFLLLTAALLTLAIWRIDMLRTQA